MTIRVVDRRALHRTRIDVDRVADQVERDLLALRRTMQSRLDAQVATMSDATRQRLFGDTRRPRIARPEKQTREDVAGKVSNLRAWLYNESRRTEEVVVDITKGGISRAMARAWANRLEWNPNVLDLSVTSHSRAVSRNMVLDFARESGMSHLALLVPQSRERNMRPSGLIARFAGKLLRIDQWLAEFRALNERRNSLPSGFSLGLHHGDFTQWLPVFTQDTAGWTGILALYRKRLLRRIRRGQ